MKRSSAYLHCTAQRLVAAVAMMAALAGCMVYVPGRQAYWDSRIKTLCEVDGGVQILEQVALSPAELNSLPRSDGRISVRMKSSRSTNQPLVSELAESTYLNERNPTVRRDVTVVVRTSDGKVVARWVEYSRVGGDVPLSVSHPSSYSCPDPREILDALQNLFVVRNES